MPYIPHTADDVLSMLADMDLTDIAQLFNEIPADMPKTTLADMADGLTEMETHRLLQQRCPEFDAARCFLGAGAYRHFIPSAIWQLVSRGEFLTAYTPYQAEASQGGLQIIYEYQTMMARLTGMEVSNASLYDGATALVEAALMAVRIHKSKRKTILVPHTLHPHYLAVLKTLLPQQSIEVVSCAFDPERGTIDGAQLDKSNHDDVAALVIPQPNFFGGLEAVDKLTDWAHQHGALVIAVVNPTSLALLREPGQWGQQGADIVCGEGQPLGIPLSYGGPYFGFFCTRQKYIRQMPGRIVGMTRDKNGNEGFVLTLQAREQHIRRAKATSNICTNQGLMVVAATIYLSLLGDAGLRQVATQSHQRAQQLQQLLCELPGVKRQFAQAFFHEFVVTLPKPAAEVIADLREQGFYVGYDLSLSYPELKNSILICATETKTEQDLIALQQAIAGSLAC